jgi:hypothetical protein
MNHAFRDRLDRQLEQRLFKGHGLPQRSNQLQRRPPNIGTSWTDSRDTRPQAPALLSNHLGEFGERHRCLGAFDGSFIDGVLDLRQRQQLWIAEEIYPADT